MSLTITGPSAATLPVQSAMVTLVSAYVDPNPPHNLVVSYMLSPTNVSKTVAIALSAAQLSTLKTLIQNAIETNEGWAANSSTSAG